MSSPAKAGSEYAGLDPAGGEASDYANNNPYGFIKDRPRKSRERRMRWTPENDRKLLLIGLGREISMKEYPKIAGLFPENPTPKSIQERLTKLRAEQLQVLQGMSMAGPQANIQQMLGSSSNDDAAGEGSDELSGLPMLEGSKPAKRKRTAKTANSPGSALKSERSEVFGAFLTDSSPLSPSVKRESKKSSGAAGGELSLAESAMARGLAKDLPMGVLSQAIAQIKEKREREAKEKEGRA